eukprot:15157005-Heterocapsa_arctica.AAC.1
MEAVKRHRALEVAARQVCPLSPGEKPRNVHRHGRANLSRAVEAILGGGHAECRLAARRGSVSWPWCSRACGCLRCGSGA